MLRWFKARARARQSAATARGPVSADDYPGDLPRGAALPPLSYDPHPDGLADPGEVVWAWVPFEEADGRGKDRPVLIIGRTGELLLGLMLTSKDHDRDARREAAAGRHWLDVGTGGWDREGRRSEARLDRVLRLRPSAVRREGSALPRGVFDRVTAAAMALHAGR
jgi:hypothetical protein